MNEKYLSATCIKCGFSHKCHFSKECNTPTEYRQPNLKKLVCLINLLEELAEKTYKKGDCIQGLLYSDCLYEIAWIFHNELQETINTALKWEEPNQDYKSFEKVRYIFNLFVERGKLSFLREQKERLFKLSVLLSEKN